MRPPRSNFDQVLEAHALLSTTLEGTLFDLMDAFATDAELATDGVEGVVTTIRDVQGATVGGVW